MAEKIAESRAHCPDLLAVCNLARERAGTLPRSSFRVPAFLVTDRLSAELVEVGEPYRFYLSVLEDIVSQPAPKPRICDRGLTSTDTVYLSFIRTFAALDGRIGTALSQIAFLRHVRDRLGVTVFLSLPTSVIGVTNRKGTRGSPFAARDPFAIDPSFADPLFPELGPDVQYRALVQACHVLGMRAGSIVPMATLAMDCPWFAADPRIGFWWDGEPGQLLCGPGNVTTPAERDSDPVIDNVFPATPDRFVEPPAKVVVATWHGQRFYVSEGARTRVTLANAFPPPGGRTVGTMTWADVAMVKYTTGNCPAAAGAAHAEATAPTAPARTLMAQVLKWRHEALGEEVFLIDVNPSVPAEVLELARAGSPEASRCMTFIGEELWSYDSPSRVLDAVVGPLVYGVSAHTRNLPILVESLRYHLRLLDEHRPQTVFLAAGANHDTTPPTPEGAAILAVCYAFMPGAIPLIYSGTEFHAQLLTNAQFGSCAGDLQPAGDLPIAEDDLALFNDVPLDWDSLPRVDGLGRPVVSMPLLMLCLRQLRADLLQIGGWEYRLGSFATDNPLCFGYELRRPDDPRDWLRVVMNWDTERVARIASEPDRTIIVSVNSDDLASLLEQGQIAPCSAVVETSARVASELSIRVPSVFGKGRPSRTGDRGDRSLSLMSR